MRYLSPPLGLWMLADESTLLPRHIDYRPRLGAQRVMATSESRVRATNITHSQSARIETSHCVRAVTVNTFFFVHAGMQANLAYCMWCLYIWNNNIFSGEKKLSGGNRNMQLWQHKHSDIIANIASGSQCVCYTLAFYSKVIWSFSTAETGCKYSITFFFGNSLKMKMRRSLWSLNAPSPSVLFSSFHFSPEELNLFGRVRPSRYKKALHRIIILLFCPFSCPDLLSHNRMRLTIMWSDRQKRRQINATLNKSRS